MNVSFNFAELGATALSHELTWLALPHTISVFFFSQVVQAQLPWAFASPPPPQLPPIIPH
jgi:hypothetical protein